MTGSEIGRVAFGARRGEDQMAKSAQKVTLSPSRDIPFDKLVLSQSNVWRIKAGISIEDLAVDFDRRGLLKRLNVLNVQANDDSETVKSKSPLAADASKPGLSR
jgi:ParB family chromosome partitioning protein